MADYDFAERLSKLRTNKGISARDMSLSLGQNAGYINNIENGKALPSLTSFFYICDYLGTTPSDFFKYNIDNPQKYHTTIENIEKLNSEQLEIVSNLIDYFIQNK